VGLLKIRRLNFRPVGTTTKDRNKKEKNYRISNDCDQVEEGQPLRKEYRRGKMANGSYQKGEMNKE